MTSGSTRSIPRTTLSRMAMGKRRRSPKQTAMWVGDPLAARQALPSSPADLETSLAVEPIHTLVIHRRAIALDMKRQDGSCGAKRVRSGNGTAKTIMNGLQSVIGGRDGSIQPVQNKRPAVAGGP